MVKHMDRDSILQVIIKNAAEVLPELRDHDFQPDDSLAQLGANSMDRSEILMMTLEDLALKAPAVAFHGAKNIGALADAIHEKLAAVH